MGLSQQEFNQLVESYNQDYLSFLKRLSAGNYRLLNELLQCVKDYQEMILMLQKLKKLQLEVTPLPFDLVRKTDRLRALGFTRRQIKNIHRAALLVARERATPGSVKWVAGSRARVG